MIFEISLLELVRIAVVPTKIESSANTKFGDMNKVHYGQCENSKWWRLSYYNTNKLALTISKLP